MGASGLADASSIAVLNANYVAARLHPHFPVLYTGEHGRVAHECIIDLRPITKATGVTVDDVAKRLIDYGLHAPTMSFPVAGTLMVEPTESESLFELDRFCDAMIAIKGEIDDIADGVWPLEDSPLRNAPHTAEDLIGDWKRPYDRQLGAYPLPMLRAAKYFPPGFTHRLRVRRSQPDLQLRAAGSACCYDTLIEPTGTVLPCRRTLLPGSVTCSDCLETPSGRSPSRSHSSNAESPTSCRRSTTSTRPWSR